MNLDSSYHWFVVSRSYIDQDGIVQLVILTENNQFATSLVYLGRVSMTRVTVNAMSVRSYPSTIIDTITQIGKKVTRQIQAVSSVKRHFLSFREHVAICKNIFFFSSHCICKSTGFTYEDTRLARIVSFVIIFHVNLNNYTGVFVTRVASFETSFLLFKVIIG